MDKYLNIQDKVDIKSLEYADLTEFIISVGGKGFNAGQVYKWLHSGAISFDEMTNLSKPLREKLSETAVITSPQIVSKLTSTDGTVKYLWEMYDGERVESVLMSYKHGNTVCLSTQAGCRMGCIFCASGKNGLARNLHPSEILDQVIFIEKDSGKRVHGVVLMGMGEPLDNYQNVLSFLHIVNHPGGLAIGMRHVSLSTSGLCDKIEALMKENLQLTLSISLHAPNDQIRNKLMPVNRAFNLKTLLETCRNYADVTGRRISYEYALISGVNDAPANAAELAAKLSGSLCHVNLILLNPVEGEILRPSSRETAEKFKEALISRGINATLRRRLGKDIDAACGQLRNRNK